MAAEWERQPGETNRAYAAFTEYLKMPPHERSLARVAEKLQKTPQHIENWSRRWGWVKRVGAYDDYNLHNAITVNQSTISQAQGEHVKNMTLAYAVANELVIKVLNDMRISYAEDGEASAVNIQRMIKSLIDLDTATRRTLNLPTTYKTQTVDDVPDETQVFFIGGE